MKPGFKKILLFLTIPVILVGILHYTISYKIKNVLQLIVENRSNHSYSFHAKKIEVSFWNKNLIVEDAQLISLDSTKAKTHYGVEIPHMTMEIESWMDMLFHQKILIHHLSFIDSKIHIHEKSIHNAKTPVNLKDVFKSFEDVLRFLEIKAFAVTNSSFYYKTIHSEKELRAEGINFSVQNLSQKNEKGHLLYSEDIRIDIKNQEWNLPDGIHTVSFKQLSFSGKNEFFELDSFTVKTTATSEKGAINLYADKFFFNSLEFESMYQKNILDIDTLLCVRPVLTIVLDKNKPSSSNTPKSLSNFLPQLFKESHINYINIEDGQILLKQDIHDQTNTLVQKSNLKIYNLSINEARAPYVNTDSILFGLKDIKFITPDSTFEIVASELMIINNDLVLRNTFFGPAGTNVTGKSISFYAPEFRLNDINFVDLIEKKLNATQAELYNPNIVVKSTKNNPKKTDTSVVTIEHFYSSLHSFRELVGIKRLRIIDGNIHIKNSDKQNTSVTMEGINALILPINFVNSSALLDIKHSLPEIKIAKILVESDQMNIVMKHFSFDGVDRKNYADYIHLRIQNKIDIEGKKLYWGTFDWDLFQKYKRIDIKEFSAQTLSINANAEEAKNSSAKIIKDLPDIRVGKLNIKQLSVHSSMIKDTLSFTARNVLVDSLHTIKRFFAWKIVDGIYENIHIQKEDLTAHIQLLTFNTLTEVVIKHVLINSKENNTTFTIKIPAITILGNFYSTDFSRVNIQKLNIQNPSINYTNVTSENKKYVSKKAFSIPINIAAKELTISNAQISYRQIHAEDTLSVSGKCTIKMEKMFASKSDENIFAFDAITMDVSQLFIAKNFLSIAVPAASIQSKNGSLKSMSNNAIAFESDLSVHWNEINLSKANIKNNGTLRLENISGNFIKHKFSYTTEKPITWQSILNSTSIDQGILSFFSNNAVFRVNEIKWQNKLNTLSFNDISYQPAQNMDDAIKNASSQFDYLTLAGKSVRIKNITLGGTTSDSLIHIQNIILDQFELTSTRDKNVPKKHVKLKEMPTKIIQSIAWPIVIDSINVRNSSVIVHQIEAKTYKKAIIPIGNINATITNITNQTRTKDSLYLIAQANILGVAVNSFTYTESYADSLSYFHATSNINPGDFVSLNALTVPLANLTIDNGYSNELNAVWAGNKYAAIGKMDFVYKDLAVHMLSKNDTSQNNIALRIENELAKQVINKENTESSVLFFERNPEKQIFHYWLKATLQGVYSSIGVRSSEKYLKHYEKVKQKYHLPHTPAINKKPL